MSDEIKLVDYRGAGGLNGTRKAVEQAIWDNLEILKGAIEGLKAPKKKSSKGGE